MLHCQRMGEVDLGVNEDKCCGKHDQNRATPNSWAAGSAPFDSSSAIVSLPPWPSTWIVAVLATVA